MSKCKRKVTNEEIEEYRSRDRENHHRKRKGMLNFNEVELVTIVSSEDDGDFDNMNQLHVVNDNVLIEEENVELERENIIIENDTNNFFNEPYMSLCYNQNEVPCNEERKTSDPKPSRTLKWLIEIDETILSTLEGKRSH